jgi:DNA-binding IclR family transcriptional regulator
MRPPEALPSSQAAVLIAVISQDQPTVRTIASATHLSPSRVHTRLVELKALGLITWTKGRHGTLRGNLGLVRTLD